MFATEVWRPIHVSFGVSPSPIGRGRGRLGGARQSGQGEPTIQSCGALLVVREPDLVDGGLVAIRCRVGMARRECDVLLHRPTSGGLVIELEPAGPALDVSARVEAALQPILSADSLDRLSEASAQVFQELTGYDRVLVFRFDDEGRGEVIAERRRDGIASCLCQHFGDAQVPP